MNIPLPLMDAIRRVAARHGSPRAVEKRTYVFIFVPFNVRGNGHARKARITQELIRNGSHADGTRADAVFRQLLLSIMHRPEQLLSQIRAMIGTSITILCGRGFCQTRCGRRR
jgi:hypothetical protein